MIFSPKNWISYIYIFLICIFFSLQVGHPTYTAHIASRFRSKFIRIFSFLKKKSCSLRSVDCSENSTDCLCWLLWQLDWLQFNDMWNSWHLSHARSFYGHQDISHQRSWQFICVKATNRCDIFYMMNYLQYDGAFNIVLVIFV